MQAVQVVDLGEFYHPSMGNGALDFLMEVEGFKRRAEENPLPGLPARVSTAALLLGFAGKAHEEAMSFKEGHPKQIEKLRLRDALQLYAAQV